MNREMGNSLKDKVALVTGASSGIGLETCILLLEKGVRVYMVGRDLLNLKTRLSKFSFEEGQLNFIQANLLNDSDVLKIVEKVGVEGKLDFLVHSAGVIFLGPFEKVGIEKLDEQYRINVRAPYLLTQKLLPMITKSKGQIVFVNSTAGLSSWENNSQYSASKHALRAIANSLRKEVAYSGVKVVSVFPGATDTPMQRQVQQMEGNEYNPDVFLAVSEVARSIVYSMSLPQNSIVTEITIRPNKY